jgi:hypothetical protein
MLLHFFFLVCTIVLDVGHLPCHDPETCYPRGIMRLPQALSDIVYLMCNEYLDKFGGQSSREQNDMGCVLLEINV